MSTARSGGRKAPVAQQPTRPIRIGISSCLLGEAVRFDGGHKRDPFLTEMLGRFVEWVPVCPEVECGFGTPRESMRLVRESGDGVRLLTIRTRVDLTSQIEQYSARRIAELEREDLSGYVLKKDSPSCGLERVKVYDAHGGSIKAGRGIFAAALLGRMPHLPAEEEGRLLDAKLRENFIERVFAYARLRDLFRSGWNLGTLVQFHTAHKLILMAHSPDAYARLGRLVAQGKSMPRDLLERRYSEGFMSALSMLATRGRHANVLQHMAGYFKDRLDRSSRAELVSVIDEYRRGLVPLVVPITLMKHHVRVHDMAYLANQLYLQPHPFELMLRNHV